MRERLSLTEGGASDALDRLAEAAARRTPAAGDDDALIREALIVGRARARAATRRRRTWAGAAGLLAVAGALVGLGAQTPPAPSAAPPGTMEMVAFGHRVEALDGARIEALEADPERALWRLDRGAALFEVAPSAARGGFEVQTPHATVRVHGTVFSVSVEDAGTRVEVYEGRVEVRDRRGARVLDPGESYATRASVTTPEALVSRGERAAQRREAIARTPPVRERAAEAPIEASEPTEPSETSEVAVAPAVEPAAAAPRSSPPIDLAGLRSLCERGEWARALEAAASARPPRAKRGEWAMLEGDAHRALGQSAEAARAYERAAAALTPTRAALAGFLAATQHERAGQPDAALAVLERTHAAERGSPLEERALAMRASLLARVGRSAEARTAARAYLAAFPGGEAVSRMEALSGAR